MFFYQKDQKIYVTRELKTIVKLEGLQDFDRIGIAQYLMIGNPLGKRTLFENVIRLEPQNLVRISLNSLKVELIEINQFNFENKIHKSKSLNENAKYLTDLLHETCRKMIEAFPDKTNVLSLSGGLDSRTVGAALKNENIKFESATILDPAKEGVQDSYYAEIIAKILNSPWQEYKLNYPNGQKAKELIDMCFGGNYLGMTFIIEFYEGLIKKYGRNILYITGETGLDIRNFLPHRDLNTIEDLIQFILDNKTHMPLDQACELVKVSKELVVSDIRNELLRYPENDLKQKFIHFQFLNYNLNWCIHGVERSRMFFEIVFPLILELES